LIPLFALAVQLTHASAAPFFPIATAWRASLPGAPSAPPVADPERVFVSLRAGRLIALALPSGRERWSAELLSAHRPAIGGGLLFVTTATGLRALDTATGAPKWQLETGPLAAAAVWHDEWLVAGTESGEVLAVRGAEGTVVWRRQAGRLSAAPSIDGDRLILPMADGRVVLADLTTGAERWSRTLGGPPGPALVDDERVFVGARDNHFYSLDARNGSVRWRWRTAADVVGPPAVDEERVYFVSFDNVLRALDRWHGAQRWRRALPMRAYEGPMVAGGVIVVAGLAPDVLFFNPRNGAPAGRWSATDQLGTSIVLTPGADRMRMIAIAGGIASEWAAIGVGADSDSPTEPLSVVPGTPLPPEDAPAPGES
jgi:outer membrane protein assembly factor BamB